MTSSPDLPVPDAALDAARRGQTRPINRAEVAAIAGPVVATVLREEAERLNRAGAQAYGGASLQASASEGYSDSANRLRARADHLDPLQ